MNINSDQSESPDHIKFSFKYFLIIFLLITVNSAAAFIYDNPAALQDVMIESLTIDYSTISSFYSWYSWPNVLYVVDVFFLIYFFLLA
jgi:hypothetical protein